jgi:hypothetical protein
MNPGYFADQGPIPSRNALIGAAPRPGQNPGAAAPASLSALLAGTIGHAAMLADTPEKWASTIAMLKRNGVDPEGFEDFEKGRPAAMVAAGISMPGKAGE